MKALEGRYVVDGKTGCWLWTGSLNNSGYGGMYYRGRVQTAQRVAYQEGVGEIPDGAVIDHLCGTRRCVNSDHLEAVTQRENVLRGSSIFAENAAKTHCKRGHPLSGENLYVRKKTGFRNCKACRNQQGREHRARSRDGRRDTQR